MLFALAHLDFCVTGKAGLPIPDIILVIVCPKEPYPEVFAADLSIFCCCIDKECITFPRRHETLKVCRPPKGAHIRQEDKIFGIRMHCPSKAMICNHLSFIPNKSLLDKDIVNAHSREIFADWLVLAVIV